VTEKKRAFLPYGQQYIDADDVEAVTAALRSDWLTTGPAVSQFEADMVGITGARHAVACANGTAALHLCALVLGLGPGDSVIVPTLTFLATVNAIRYVGAEVVFADVDPDTGLLSPKTLRSAIDGHMNKSSLKAVFVVHINGQSADMSGIQKIAQEGNLKIVEDACHALGGTQRDAHGRTTPVGACAMSDLTVFSFHPVKTVTMGEGGVVTTNNDDFNDRLRALRSHGIIRDAAHFVNQDLAFDQTGGPNPWYYEMHELGYNYRATDIQCALGSSQLKKLEWFVARRTELVKLYDQSLQSLAPAVRPVSRVNFGETGWHLYVVRINFKKIGVSRSDFMKKLSELGIGTQVHYVPVHRQPYYQERYGKLNCPGADAYYAQCLSLPLFPAMADEDVSRVVDGLSSILTLNT